MNAFCLRFVVSIALLAIIAPVADAAIALNEKIDTPLHGWVVKFFDADGTDKDFCDATHAQRVADAIDSGTGNFPQGGSIAQYLTLGFYFPNINGNDCLVDYINANNNLPAGTSIDGDANYSRIRIHASFAQTNSETDVRPTVAHEVFHGVEYAYVGVSKKEALGDFAVEGLAAVMEDKIFTDLDGLTSTAYRSRVDSYLADPNIYLWSLDYDSTLFWSYLMEQFGTNRTEPYIGTDFIRSFWEKAEANDADMLDVLEKTITAHERYSTTVFGDYGGELKDLFMDFAIANYAKRSVLTNLADAGKYRYVDETSSTTAYDAVALSWSNAVPPTRGPVSDNVAKYGAKYYEANVSGCAAGNVFGFRAQSDSGDKSAFAVLAYKGSVVDRIFQTGADVSSGNSAAVAIMQPATSKYTKLVAVAVGFDGGSAGEGFTDLTADFTYTFACGPATINIKQPTSVYPAYVNTYDAPDRFLARVSVSGPAELSAGSVEGLTADMFTAWVGTDTNPTNQAQILSAAYVQGEYWLTVQAPTKPGPSPTNYSFTVKLGTLSDTEEDAVKYQQLLLDQMLVLDRSGSMAGDKMDSAKSAAQLFVDSTQTDDRLGLVSFTGNGAETNNDATNIYHLQSMSSNFERDLINQLIDLSPNLTPSGTTCIGDGLVEGANDIVTNGQPGEDWIILLSDGYENEGQFYTNALPTLRANGIHVETIALGGVCDAALLQQIASDTGGRYYFVDDAPPFAAEGGGTRSSSCSGMANNLADTMTSIMEDMHRFQRLWEARGTVATGATNTYSIPIQEGGIDRPTFSFHWLCSATTLGVTIKRPDGTALANGIASVKVWTNSNNAVVQLPSLTNGTWTVELKAVAGSPQYFAALSGKNRQGPQLNLYFAQYHGNTNYLNANGKFLRGLPQPILASLTDSSGAVRGASVLATIRHPTGTMLQLRLLDDGAHNDGQANDGIYGNLYTPTTAYSPSGLSDTPPPAVARGSYNVSLTASGVGNVGLPFSRIKKGSFQIYDKTDNPDPDTDHDGMPDRYELLHNCLNAALNDAAGDADGDGVSNLNEYLAGTDPCNMDTDGGGESDASEAARGANPFDPLDDALPQPQDVEVISRVCDSLPETNAFLLPNKNLIRYPANSAYQQIKLFRGLTSTGPFTLVTNFNSATFGGLFYDSGLVNGTTYFYYVQAVDAAGHTSASSHVFSGRPRANPNPPSGFVIIADGAKIVDAINVPLTLFADTNTAEMMIANDGAFTGAVWQPYTNRLVWTLKTNSTGLAHVYVRFRTATLFQSVTFANSVNVAAFGSLGAVNGVAKLQPSYPAGSSAGISIATTNGGYATGSDNAGNFKLNYLNPGTYNFTLSHHGYATVTVTNVSVAAGSNVNIGTNVLTAIDSDGDGLLDIQEFVLGTDPRRKDTDGDGFTDGQEVNRLHTNPLDPASNLHMIGATVSGTNVTVTWTSVTGVVYRVDYKTNISVTNWTILATVPASAGPTTSYVDSTTSSSSRLYRVLVP